MAIYVAETESKFHAWTSWARATQVSLRYSRRFKQHLWVVMVTPSKRKATVSAKAIQAQLLAAQEENYKANCGWFLSEHDTCTGRWSPDVEEVS